MYQNPYVNNYAPTYSQQGLTERIDNQIAQLQQMKEQMKNNIQPAINQTFQLAPNHQNGMRYANSLDEVNKEPVYVDTAFFSKDMSVVWVKNNKNEIKTYELNELIPRDEKDMQIEYLQEQIEELKGMIKNEQPITDVDTEQNATNTTKNDESTRKPVETGKSTSIQKVSRSKEK